MDNKGKSKYTADRKFSKRPFSRDDKWYDENKQKINDLFEQVKNIANAANYSLNNDREPIFLADNKNKPVKLIMINGTEKTGILLDISIYGILLEIDKKTAFIFKHAIAGYTSLDE